MASSYLKLPLQRLLGAGKAVSQAFDTRSEINSDHEKDFKDGSIKGNMSLLHGRR
jgi:hypothetical protein